MFAQKLISICSREPSFLYVETSSAYVLMELVPGEVAAAGPYFKKIVPQASADKPLITHCLSKTTFSSRGYWQKVLPWYETLDEQSLEFLQLDKDQLLGLKKNSNLEVHHVDIPQMHVTEFRRNALRELSALIEQCHTREELQSRLKDWNA